MTNKVSLGYFGIGLAATFVLVGCNGTEGEQAKQLAPDFVDGTGQVTAEKAYPAGPYGYNKGSIIQNYELYGLVNSMVDNETFQEIKLGDFYNPHGRDAAYVPASPEEDDRLYPAGSPYGAGTPKPTVMNIDIGSVWCPPCNEEAKSLLPVLYAKYKPCGGELLLALADGPDHDVPASTKHLYNWTKKYKENFPAVIDPQYKLKAVFSEDAYPANLIIDTTTMKIVQVVAGGPSEGSSYWKSYEKLLPDPSCPDSL